MSAVCSDFVVGPAHLLVELGASEAASAGGAPLSSINHCLSQPQRPFASNLVGTLIAHRRGRGVLPRRITDSRPDSEHRGRDCDGERQNQTDYQKAHQTRSIPPGKEGVKHGHKLHVPASGQVR